MFLQTRRARLIAGVLAAVLLLAAGYAIGVLTPMFTRPGDNSTDAGFARDMAIHHAQAVEMGMVAYRTSDDPELQTIGYDIATTQQYQIGEMQAWLDEWHLSYSSTDGPMRWMPDGPKSLLPDGRMPGMATNEEIDSLKGQRGKAFDIMFCQLMLRHHLGGVHMADEAVTLVKQPQVKSLAEQIKQTQQLEITTLSAKLKSLGGQPLGTTDIAKPAPSASGSPAPSASPSAN
jgi:uncharacterized protein (DUF305 family)